jgi:hypothetical protein
MTMIEWWLLSMIYLVFVHFTIVRPQQKIINKLVEVLEKFMADPFSEISDSTD